MFLAAAQIQDQKNFQTNLEEHLQLATLAADKGAGLVLFPEMSLTGYLREGANDQALVQNDSRLEPLRKLAAEKNILLIVGAPLLLKDKLYIASIIINPDGSEDIYTKQYLHEGEEKYFKASFEYNPGIDLQGEKIQLATCYDIEVPEHAAAAGKAGTTIYLANIFYSPGSMDHAHQLLSNYARNYKMAVMMANYCGECWGMLAGGRSAFWNRKGLCRKTLNIAENGLLLIEV